MDIYIYSYMCLNIIYMDIAIIYVYIYTYWLVVWNMNFIFHNIYGIIMDNPSRKDIHGTNIP